ncbi:RNA-binding protein 34 [Armadillidium vulgare]|nr:RNA-binding protein 34 [Armadillidium vulgare]
MEKYSKITTFMLIEQYPLSIIRIKTVSLLETYLGKSMKRIYGNFLEACGKVTNVRVVRSSSTGAGKGFAFVTFESNDGVQLALHLNGKEFMKREIRVKKLAKKVKVKEQTKSSLKPVKRKAGANFSSKSKKVSKPMDVSFLKDDKPKLFNDKIKEKGKKRKRNDKSGEKLTKPKDFKGVRAVKDGKVLKKGKKKFNQTERRKFVLAKKLATTL